MINEIGLEWLIFELGDGIPKLILKNPRLYNMETYIYVTRPTLVLKLKKTKKGPH